MTSTNMQAAADRRTDAAPILSIRDLVVEYRTGAGTTVRAVRNVNLDLLPGEAIALVGESGCGKTTLGLGLLRLLPRLGHASGSVIYRQSNGTEVEVLELEGRALRNFRWNEAAMVFQGAQSAFNPVLKIRSHMRAKEIEERSAELLRLVRLEPSRVLGSYPHELSGGMRQRVLIAMSLLLDPQVLVLDEPTTALDILTQRSVVDVLHEIRDRLGFAMIFISHDLSLAAELADRVATMYAGRLIETGSVRDLFYRPRHPYSVGLIKAVPPIVGDLPDMESIPGGPPSLANLPSGCSFHPRCRFATDECHTTDPALEPITDEPGDDHEAACIHTDQVHLDRSVGAHDPEIVTNPDAGYGDDSDPKVVRS